MLLSFLMASLVSMIGIMVSLRSGTVRQAQQKLGVSVFVIAYLVPMAGAYGLKYVPAEIRESVMEAFQSGAVTLPTLIVSAILAVLTLPLYAVTKARFQRAKRIFDD
jgi:ABC-2 type transport system permease protein